jgi:hypothetical protein
MLLMAPPSPAYSIKIFKLDLNDELVPRNHSMLLENQKSALYLLKKKNGDSELIRKIKTAHGMQRNLVFFSPAKMMALITKRWLGRCHNQSF